MVIKMKLLKLCIIITLLFNNNLFPQVLSELEFIIDQNPLVKQRVESKRADVQQYVSEFKIASLSIIKLYQTCISSQQNGQKVCTFTPSCSHFGFTAIKLYGPFWGLILTSDRFQRCHGFSRRNYQTHIKTGKLFDPIENYSFIQK